MLAFPFSFLSRLMTPVPNTARPSKRINLERRKQWVDLADAISKRNPTASTWRTVQFLLMLARDDLESNIDAFPSFPWLEGAEVTPMVDTAQESPLGKFCPAMHFRAKLIHG